MKKFLILFFITQSYFTQSYSQSDCAFPNIGSTNSSSFAGIDFFSESACDPLILKCNIVILTRNNGTGGFSPSSSLWSDWEDAMNLSLANIQDPNCFSNGYPLDSKIRVKFNKYTISNTLAWDWYGETTRDNFTGHPNDYICQRFYNNTLWLDLETEMANFEQAHFGEINFFFVENGELIDLLESHIANGTRPSSKYVDRFEQAGNPIASGCSVFPKSYISLASQNSYVIADRYSDYLIRQHFHDIWFPKHAHESPETVWGWSFYGNTLMYLHEMGHNIMTTFHNTSCGQLMTSIYDERTNYITKQQLNTIHKNLATTDLHNAVDCNSLLEGVCPIKISSNATISSPMSVYGDIIIQDGVTLTITSEVYLSELSKIIVRPHAKLIVNGGKLTNGCGSFWQGVVVYGGNSDFDVKFHSNAIIENTAKAAVSMFSPESWPNAGLYGNGILHADNTTFNNTRRIVELMSWSPLPNTSHIKYCVQNGGKWSITNWNCQGVEVSNSVFNNISSNCIVSEAGSFLIEGNTFNSAENDILFNNVSAGIGSNIKKNTFNGSNIGYNARGTTLAQNVIEKNTFQTTYVGALNDGFNNFNLLSNDFSDPLGCVSIDVGSGAGDVVLNKFSNNFIGTLVGGSNPDFNFIKNCYNTNFTDVYIEGMVSPLISDGINPANNCFTHLGNASSNIQDIGGNPNPFNYLEPSGNNIDCRDAILSHSNVNRQFTPNGGTLEFPRCGINGILGGDTIYQDECYPISNSSSNINSYNSLQVKINEILNSNSLTMQEKTFELLIYRRCLKKVIGRLFEDYIKSENYTSARNLYSGNTNDDAIISVYSSYIFQNDLNAARTFLNQIEANSESMQDFKTIQNINLNRLPYGPFYQADTIELNTIRQIALKTHPNATFAKSLYYALSGEVLSSPIPNFSSHGLNQHTKSSKVEKELITCVPNPFNQELRIEINGIANFDILIQDINRRTIYTNKVKSNLIIINTKNWQSGFYILHASKNNDIIATKKLILQK